MSEYAWMKTVYLSIYRIIGIFELPGNTRYELWTLPSGQSRAFLTMEREPYFLHLRRCAAYGRMITQMLVDKVNGPLAAPERFNAALSQVSISEDLHEDHPLLIVETTGTIENVMLDRLNDMGTCCIGLSLFDQTDIANTTKAISEAAICGVSLLLPHGITPTVQVIGNTRLCN